MAGPLSHLRVLDMSRILAGPWAGQALADLGAEVIKIERPGEGDDTRGWGPPYLAGTDGKPTAEAAYYLAANRGKKSVAVDISKPEGQKLVKELAAISDILIENYKVGGLLKYGLAYEDLRQLNPGLIYCSITGFGQTGPYKDLAGYDFMIQAMGGLMSVTGERDDLPGGGPQKAGVAVADLMTGMYATVAILAAVAHRDRTGEGQYIDMALLDCQVAMMANQNMNYLVSGKAPGRMGNAHMNIVPYQVFATSDGHIIIAVGNDGQFTRFCAVAGCPELALDPRFKTNSDRLVNRGALIPLIEEIVSKRKRDDWLRSLEAATVPCGPINTLDQVFNNPQVKHRQLRRDMSHPLAGIVPQVVSPIKFSVTALEYDLPPPLLGQHTDQVLRQLLHLSEAALEKLRQQGIVASP
jgi:crotonobetainyl-CoA:carnitine CoA-transferase CaiB-like acyl-CoA transferase